MKINIKSENTNFTFTYENKETGFKGKLYGDSSLVIQNEKIGYYMHTGSRNINTYKELKELVDEQPEFLKIINKNVFKAYDKVVKENKC